MGAYKFADDETTDAIGIIRTADSVFIPNDDAAPAAEQNADWGAYLVWKAVPNTPDAAASTPLADIRGIEKSRIDQLADAEFLKDLLASPGSRMAGPSLFALFRTFQEALLWERKVWAQIEVEGGAAFDSLTATTWTPLTTFDTNGVASANAVADHANDKVVTGRKGVYRLRAILTCSLNMAARDIDFRLTVAGAAVPGSVTRHYFTTGSQAYQISLDAIAEIATDDRDIQVEAYSASLTQLTLIHGVLSCEKIAELDNATNYPVLDALEPNQGASIDAVAEAMVTEWEGIATRVGDTEDVRRDAHDDMDAAGTKAAIEAIDPTWPA